MTILEVCFSPSLGGLELYCLRTAYQLQWRRHKVILWARKGSLMEKHPLAKELNLHTFRQPGYFDPLFLKKAAQIIRAEKIDVIHLHRSRDMASLAPLKSTPKIFTLQIESTLSKKDLFHRFVCKRTRECRFNHRFAFLL